MGFVPSLKSALMNKTKQSSEYLSRPVAQALHGEVTGFSAAVPTFYSTEREQKTTFAAAGFVPARSLPQGVFAGTTALGVRVGVRQSCLLWGRLGVFPQAKHTSPHLSSFPFPLC